MSVFIFAEDDASVQKAIFLAKKLNIEYRTVFSDGDTALCVSQKGVALTGNGQTVYGDFTALIPRLKPNNLSGEMIVKAAKIKGSADYTVVDATAGMGEDSFLLAAAGFDVTMFERDCIIAALLEDALERALQNDTVSDITKRMKLKCEDSIYGLKHLGFVPDIIYLDPMFPQRSKSGLVKKKFQVIHTVEPPCSDGEALLNAALEVGPRKIVIKRPQKGEYLAGKKPSYSIEGKAIRYDCIVLR